MVSCVFTLDHITKRLRMYTNGQEVNNSPKDYFSSQRQVNVVPYYIGCANPNARHGDTGFFKGHMKNKITMWNNCLRPKEVGTIFNNGIPYTSTKQKSYSFGRVELKVISPKKMSLVIGTLTML